MKGAMWMVHRLRFFAGDAWDELRHSPGVNLLAVATLAAALFLAGLVLVVLSNVEARVELLRGDFRVEVFLLDDASEEERGRLQRRLAASEGVARVEYIDQEQALARYREWSRETAALVEELDVNPLPASFEVLLAPRPDAEARGAAIVQALSGKPGVEEVRFDREWLRRLESLLNLARIGGTGLATLVFAAVVFVMASVLRLAVYARRDEIEIMLLVGATPAFVRGPFLVAGLGQGLISSGVGLLLVEAARQGALAYAGSSSLALMELVAADPLPGSAAGLLVGLGLAVSCTGAYFAVRRSF